MTAKDFFRGHPIVWVKNEWVYEDTKKPTIVSYKERACGYCGSFPTNDGHDKCLGQLRGIMNACCGHGTTQEAYIQFWDGVVVSGNSVKNIITRLRENHG